MNHKWILFWFSVFFIASCDYKPRNQGRVLYERECASCHMEEGQGLGELMPPVANSDYILANKEKLACIIRYGMEGAITVNGVAYEGEMEGNQQLTDVEVTNLVHYLLVDLNKQEDHFTLAEVREQLEPCGELVHED